MVSGKMDFAIRAYEAPFRQSNVKTLSASRFTHLVTCLDGVTDDTRLGFTCKIHV